MSKIFLIVASSTKTLWTLGILPFLILGIPCLFLIFIYANRNIDFAITNGQLNIQHYFYGRSIPLSSFITYKALILDLSQSSPHWPKWRTNGIGLPGYKAGWFKLRNGERALLFVNDPHRVVYIPTTDGYSLLLSVQEPERFLNSLNNR